MNPPLPLNPLIDPRLDSSVEEFELALQRNSGVDVLDYLPAEADPQYAEIAVELLRVEMEASFRRGEPRRLSDYRARFAGLLDHEEWLASLAYEEYRCRLQAGETVTREEYQRGYQLDTRGWPVGTRPEVSAHEADTLAAMADFVGDTDRLLRAIQPFPAVGDQFGDFYLIQKIGQGAFGSIFLAQQGQLADRPVVLKITAGYSPEPRHLARLQHTHIVPIYSVDRRDELTAVCMPYLGLGTVADVVRELTPHSLPTTGAPIVAAFRRTVSSDGDSRALPRWAAPINEVDEVELSRLAALPYEEVCARLTADLAAALDHAHRRGILHRDLKPANILLTADGRPMLLDFNVSDEIEPEQRMCAVVGGTWPYMSPEHRRAMRTGELIDARSDLYSLGVLLYQLLTGALPDTESSELSKINVRDMQRANPRVSHDLASIVQHCLEPDPANRYQTAAELSEDLQRHLDYQSPRFAPARWSIERVQKWSQRHPRLSSATTIGTLALCVLVAVSGLLVMRDGQLARLRAERRIVQIEDSLPALRVAFSSPELDETELRHHLQTVRALLGSLTIPPGQPWRSHSEIRRLDELEVETIRDGLAELNYLGAVGAMQLALIEGGEGDGAWSEAAHFNQAAREYFDSGDVPVALLRQQQLLARRDSDTQERGASEAEVSVDDGTPMTHVPSHRRWLAQHYLSQGEYSRAMVLFQQICETDSLDYSNWFLLGNAYAGCGSLSQAEGCYSTCIALWPDAYLSYFNRALCRYEQRRYGEAELDWDIVLQKRPDLAAAYFNRSLARKARNDLRGALADLDQSLTLSGPMIRTLLVRARVHDALGSKGLADEDRAASNELVPRYETDWTARALARSAEDPVGALADLQQARQRWPTSRHVLRNLAHVLAERMGRMEEASEVLSEMLSRTEIAEDRMSLAVLRARLGDRAQALAEGSQALGDGTNAKLVFQMACVHAILAAQYPDQISAACRLLARSFLMQPQWIDVARRDPDLRSIQTSPQFRALMAASRVVVQTSQPEAADSEDLAGEELKP